LEREQTRGRKIEGITRTKATDSKVQQCRITIATNAIASSLAKETRSSTVSTNRACSNRRD